MWSNIAGIKYFTAFNQNSHSKSVTSCKQNKTLNSTCAHQSKQPRCFSNQSGTKRGTHVFSRVWCEATQVECLTCRIVRVCHVQLAIHLPFGNFHRFGKTITGTIKALSRKPYLLFQRRPKLFSAAQGRIQDFEMGGVNFEIMSEKSYIISIFAG